MKKCFMMLVMLSLFIGIKAENHLSTIERCSQIYLYEISKIEWDTCFIGETPYFLYKKSESYEEAYQSLLEALNESLLYIYRGKASDAECWIKCCPIFCYLVKYLDLDIICDQGFGPNMTSKDYSDFADYFYNHL